MRTSWPALTHSSASVPPILPVPMMPILSGPSPAARTSLDVASTAHRLSAATDDAFHIAILRSRRRYLDARLEVRLSARKTEEVDGLIRQHRCAGSERVEVRPSVADPDRSRRDTVGHLGACPHLAALVEDAD